MTLKWKSYTCIDSVSKIIMLTLPDRPIVQSSYIITVQNLFEFWAMQRRPENSKLSCTIIICDDWSNPGQRREHNFFYIQILHHIKIWLSLYTYMPNHAKKLSRYNSYSYGGQLSEFFGQNKKMHIYSFVYMNRIPSHIFNICLWK